jgi:GMP synthase (glutamine-hydrolysing)
MLLVINNRSHFIADLEKRLQELKVKYELIDKANMKKVKNLHKYHGVILSGGPMLLDEKIYLEDISVDLACLMDCQGPMLGICLGHQIIGETFGGKLKRLKNLVNKMNAVTILDQKGILKGVGKKIKVQEAHHDAIVKLPPEFMLLASSRGTKIEAMMHEHRKIYSVQFHPEVSGGVGKKILKNFVDICKKDLKERKKKK